MNLRRIPLFARRLAATAILALASGALSGCSSDFASIDDVYVPASVAENNPIKVVDRPVKLTVSATSNGIEASDVSNVKDFARSAASSSAKVTVAYPSGSSKARRSAAQAAGILSRQGVAHAAISMTPYEGSSNSVTLSFTTKMAVTKPCGSWDRNMRGNQFNEPDPNLGCSNQQNVAAMVSNPEDLQHSRTMSPASSAAQGAALKDYYDGSWAEPSGSGMGSGSSGS